MGLLQMDRYLSRAIRLRYQTSGLLNAATFIIELKPRGVRRDSSRGKCYFNNNIRSVWLSGPASIR